MMEEKFFLWILSFLPIAAILILMLKFEWGAIKAAPVGLLLTIINGLFFLKANVILLLLEGIKGIWNALIILLVVGTAIFMYEVGNEAKSFEVIHDGMRKIMPNELILVLAIGWGVVSCLQGVAGFGVPVAVGAPLLMRIGVRPVWAVIISLLGQAWGNTFGTLGVSWETLAMTANLTRGSKAYLLTAMWTALFIWLWIVVAGFCICWLYGGKKAVIKGFWAVIIMSTVQGGGELLITQLDTSLSCFIPAVASLAALLLMGKSRLYNKKWRMEESIIMDRNVIWTKEVEAGSQMTLFQVL